MDDKIQIKINIEVNKMLKQLSNVYIDKGPFPNKEYIMEDEIHPVILKIMLSKGYLSFRICASTMKTYELSKKFKRYLIKKIGIKKICVNWKQYNSNWSIKNQLKRVFKDA